MCRWGGGGVHDSSDWFSITQFLITRDLLHEFDITSVEMIEKIYIFCHYIIFLFFFISKRNTNMLNNKIWVLYSILICVIFTFWNSMKLAQSYITLTPFLVTGWEIGISVADLFPHSLTSSLLPSLPCYGQIFSMVLSHLAFWSCCLSRSAMHRIHPLNRDPCV